MTARPEPAPQTSRLQGFLYMLMRDAVVPGEVERMVRDVEKSAHPAFSNVHLAAYADELARRLSQP